MSINALLHHSVLDLDPADMFLTVKPVVRAHGDIQSRDGDAAYFRAVRLLQMMIELSACVSTRLNSALPSVKVKI
jgi:hypothetical protein